MDVKKRIWTGDETVDHFKDWETEVPDDYKERLPPAWTARDQLRLESPDFEVLGTFNDQYWGRVEVHTRTPGGSKLVTAVNLFERDSEEKIREALEKEMRSLAWQLHQFDGDIENIKE